MEEITLVGMNLKKRTISAEYLDENEKRKKVNLSGINVSLDDDKLLLQIAKAVYGLLNYQFDTYDEVSTSEFEIEIPEVTV